MKYSNLEVPPSREISLLRRRGDLFGLVNTRELHASVDAYLEPSRGMPASDVSARVSYPGLVLLLTPTARGVARRQERTDSGFARTRPCGRV